MPTMIDGGTGNDTLKFIGHGMDLDMTGFAGASLRGFLSGVFCLSHEHDP